MSIESARDLMRDEGRELAFFPDHVADGDWVTFDAAMNALIDEAQAALPCPWNWLRFAVKTPDDEPCRCHDNSQHVAPQCQARARLAAKEAV